MRENISIKEAIGLEDDYVQPKAELDTLKEGIKRVTGPLASYHGIVNALEYYHSVRVEEEKKRKEDQAHQDSDEGEDEENDGEH